MVHGITAEEFARILRARIRRARQNADLTQEEVARHLEIPLDNYKKVENRSKTGLPPHLIEPFCTLTRVTPGQLFTKRTDANDIQELDRTAVAAQRRAG